MKDYAIFKVKEGKLDQWKQWCSLLMSTHHTEALDTLRQENSSREYYTLFKINGQDYVVGASEFFAEPEPSDKTVPLNLEHRRIFSECLEFIAKGESLCDLKLDI